MRKTILFTVVALVALCLKATAENVTFEQAQAQALSYLETVGVQTSTLTLVDAPKKVSPTRDEAVYYYLFNYGEDGGFIIISGDDRTQPVLAFSEEGNVTAEDVAATMQPMLESYKTEMDKIEDLGTVVCDRPRHVQSPSFSPVTPLLTCHWSQNSPYDSKSPTYGGYLCRPGCQAVAVAQLLYYYRDRMPAKLAVTIPAYTTSKRKISMSSEAKGTAFNWTKMVDRLTHASSSQISAVANLILYAGKAMQSDYDPSATAAYLNKVPTALTSYFGFSSNILQVKRSAYTLTRWKEILLDELYANRPVFMYGENAIEGAHAYIVDGFDGGEMFHVNWGHGRGDGYFLLSTFSLLQPDDEEAFVSSENSFNKNLIAYIGIQPLNGYEEVNEDLTLMSTINKVNDTDKTVTVTFTNKSGSNHKYQAGLGYLDENGYANILKTWTLGNKSLDANEAVSAVSFALVAKDFSSLGKGTYKLYPVYKADGEDDWHMCDQSATFSHIKVVYSSSGLTLSKVANAPSFTLGTLKFPGSHGKSYMQYVNFEVTNTGDEGTGLLYLYASKTTSMGSALSKVAIVLAKGESVTAQMYFTPSSTGTYNVWITDGSDVLKSGTVTISSITSANAHPLITSGYTIDNLVPGSSTKFYGDVLKGTVNIKNDGERDYAGYVSVYLYKAGYSTNLRCEHYIELNAGATKTVDFYFDDLVYGTKYGLMPIYEDTRAFVKPYKNGVIPTEGVLFFTADGDLTAAEASGTVTVPSSAVAVDLTGVAADITKVSANSNPNTIYYMGESETAPSGLSGKNVVKGTSASSISLTDGYEMYVPKTFTAQKISFTHKPSIGTGGSGGWASIVIPFDVQSVKVDNVEIDWFKSDTDYGKNFWVKEFQGISGLNTVCFGYAQEMKANHPYIMAVPNNTWGEAFNLVGKNMVFGASNVEIESNPSVLVGSETMFFRGTYANVNTTNTYVLNSTGTKFSFGSNKVKPFRGFFVAKDNDVFGVGDLNIGTFEDDTNGILHLNGSGVTRTVDVYDVRGMKVGTAEVQDGKVTLGDLPRGIYIVDGKKVVR